MTPTQRQSQQRPQKPQKPQKPQDTIGRKVAMFLLAMMAMALIVALIGSLWNEAPWAIALVVVLGAVVILGVRWYKRRQ